MTKINQHSGTLSDKPARERKPAPRTKKAGVTASSAPAPAAHEIVDLPAVQSLASSEPEAGLDVEIQTLHSQLSEQESLLEQRNAALVLLQSQLRAKDAVLREKDMVISELEESLSGQIQNLAEQLKARDELLASREAELDSLRNILDVETAEKHRSREARNRSSTEIDRLIEEQRTAKLALAKVEMEEWHVIGRRNAWKRALRAVQRLFEKPRRKQEDETLKEQLP
jgi:chromosome segregation ATPase